MKKETKIGIQYFIHESIFFLSIASLGFMLNHIQKGYILLLMLCVCAPMLYSYDRIFYYIIKYDVRPIWWKKK